MQYVYNSGDCLLGKNIYIGLGCPSKLSEWEMTGISFPTALFTLKAILKMQRGLSHLLAGPHGGQ